MESSNCRRPSAPQPLRSSAYHDREVAKRYNPSYTHFVKTAISIPDEVFAEAEAEARRLGVSRSGLYSRAVAEFVEKHRGLRVREALDSVYASEGSRVDGALARMQAASLPDEGW